MSRANSVKYALPLIIALTSAACATTAAEPELTPEEQAYKAAIEQALEPASPEEIARAERSDPVTRANFWATEHQKDSGNVETTVKFMQALRNIGSHDRVIEIASTSIPANPQNYQLYLELGRAYMAQDKTAEAAQAFMRSADFSPETDAAPVAALGLAFDRLENHKQAQEAYEIALQREPDRVSTLSNYGLSLALTGKLTEAEAALRRAVEAPGADGRVRQNLALILGLQGRFDEMSSVDPSAPMRSVEANQRVLREMMGASDSFDGLQSLDAVIDQVNRTPAAAVAMPKIHEAEVNSEAMDDPGAPGASTTSDPAPTGLRPKLRGSQGR